MFATLRRLVERISNPCAGEKEVGNVEGTRNALYIGAHVRVKLLASVSTARRQELLLDTCIIRESKILAGSQTPFAIVVIKLQESQTRMEAFDVVTVTQGMDGRSTPLS